MLRKTFCGLSLIMLMAGATTEARGKFELGLFGGARFGGSFSDGGYQNNFLLEDFDIAPGSHVGVAFYIPVGQHAINGRGILLELMFSLQETDLRFNPGEFSGIPDSVLDRFETDEDKLVLGAVDVSYIHFGMIYKFGSNSTWSPHFNMSIGTTQFKATDGNLDRSEFSFSIGGGVTKSLREALGIRGQIRTYFTTLPSDEYWVDNYGGVWTTIDNNFFFQGDLSLGIIFAF